MTEAQSIATEINRTVSKIKAGSLRFFGEWFGRPYDNGHQVVSASAVENVLTIRFNEDETLSVWDPSKSKISGSEFEIKSAS